jgi:hypothetical protein
MYGWGGLRGFPLLQKDGRRGDNGKSHLTAEEYERDSRKLQKKQVGKGLRAVFYNHEDFAGADEAQVFAGGRLDSARIALQSLNPVAQDGIFTLQLAKANGSLQQFVPRPDPAKQTTLAHHRIEKHDAAHEDQDTAHPQTPSAPRSQPGGLIVCRCRNHCVRKVPDLHGKYK